jgi:hypothetical protein
MVITSMPKQNVIGKYLYNPEVNDELTQAQSSYMPSDIR